jgi:hypothetical protein
MSFKGRTHTPATKRKIARSRTKHQLADMIEKGREYLKTTEFKKKQVPTIAGLANYLKCSQQTIYNKANTSQEFERLLEDLYMQREDKLIQGGLTRKLDSNFAMFLLIVKHGYTENPTSLTQNNYNLTPEVLKDLLSLTGSKKNR